MGESTRLRHTEHTQKGISFLRDKHTQTSDRSLLIIWFSGSHKEILGFLRGEPEYQKKKKQSHNWQAMFLAGYKLKLALE